mgnify:CR=1 FL=1
MILSNPSILDVVFNHSGIFTYQVKLIGGSEKMEIYERKKTTRFAVEQLEKLFVSLNERLEEDIANFDGEKEFFAIVEHDNGYMPGDYNRNVWKTDRTKIGYRNGELCLICHNSSFDEEYRDYFKVSADEFWRIKKINFSEMFNALKEVVEAYNEKSKEKDKQIEHFLEIAKQF